MQANHRIYKYIEKVCKHTRPAILILLVVASVTACHKSEEPKEVNNRTVIIYMMAENSMASFITSDIQEMLGGVKNIGNDDHLLIYLDDSSKPRIYVLDNKNTIRSFNNLEPTYIFPEELNSADASTLDLVMQYAITNCPAATYACSFWSHGSGWLYDSEDVSNAPRRMPQRHSFGVDNGVNTLTNHGKRMLIADMAEVLGKYPKLEYILFDACFMQTMEVAYELRNCATYIIGSPAELMAYGAPYDKILQPMFAKPFSPNALAYEYFNYYDTYYGSGVILTAIKTAEFDDFVAVMQPLIESHEWLDVDVDDCLRYYKESWNSFTRVVSPMPDFTDIKSVMQRVLTDSEMERWQAAFDRLVPVRYASNSWYTAFGDSGHGESMPVSQLQCGGVVMHFPFEIYDAYTFRDKIYTFNDDYKKTQWAKLFNIK